MNVFFMDNTKTLTVLTLKKIIEDIEDELKHECPSNKNQDPVTITRSSSEAFVTTTSNAFF